MNLNNIKILGTRLLISPIEETKTSGGLIIPDTAENKPSKGTVLESGPGEYLQSGDFIKNSVQKGDTVLFVKISGVEVKLNNEKYLIVEEKDVIAILGE